MTRSIVTRLFRVAFGLYIIVAILLNILLVVREYVDTKATIQRELAMVKVAGKGEQRSEDRRACPNVTTKTWNKRADRTRH